MNNSSCLQPSPATTVALPILYSCLFPAGIFGNILILSVWVFSQKTPTRRTQYIYLANLVTANLLVCSTMPFLAVYFAEGHRWPYESAACRLTHHLGTLVMHVSMYVTITILCSIALSQYATLKKNCGPQHSPALPGTFQGRLLHKFQRPKFARYFCVVIWLIVLCITVTAIIYNVQETVSGEFPTCYNIKVEAGEHPAMIAAFLATVCFFLFFMTVLWSYYSLTRHLNRIQENTCIEEKHLIYRTVKRNILVIQMILTVCFLPYHIFRPIFYVLLTDDDCPRLNYLVEIKNLLTCLAATKSSLDPVITLLLDKTFKKSFYGLFTKCTSEHQERNDDIFPEMGRNMERFS
ncbi:probable G-protein coupled receptor 82 [Passer domesticus]|uniref:probable G-protein coupled receptor 82 n=1 Tax=Passer domesticus TaxID=48849 RepID=UPI0030FE8874